MNNPKSDGKLGQEIYQMLTEKGVETPLLEAVPDTKKQVMSITKSFKDIMGTLHLDLKNDSLMETPKRVAKLYVDDLLWGLNYENFPRIMTVDNSMDYDHMLLERSINVQSMCEHHWVPIVGKCHIAYIPNKKVVGLSKLNRIVEFFCRRPQVQERLTSQIFYTLQHVLETESVAVIIQAEHFCVKLRGVKDQCSDTVTSKKGGAFKDNPLTNSELLTLISM